MDYHQQDKPSNQSILVLYDDAQPTTNLRWSAQKMFGDWQTFPYTDAAKIYTSMLVNLLSGLSSSEVIVQPVSTYQKESAFNHLRTFYLGTTPEQTPPEAFVQDVLKGASITWIGYNAEALNPSGQERLGIQVKGMLQNYDQVYEAAFSSIEYKGAVFSKALQAMEMLDVEVNDKVQVHAWAKNALGEQHPYLMQYQSFWLVADLPFTFIHEQDRYLVFADALRTMLNLTTSCQPTALFRVEDVSPKDDVSILEPLFKLLVEEKVHFNVSVIPYYVNEPQAINLGWQDNPQSLELLLDMARRGWAAIWQHGTTHHTQGYLNPEGISAVDWEFWDSHKFGPLENLNEDLALKQVIRGKQALYDLGFSPVGWVTPHYAAPPSYLKMFNQTYNLYFERRFVQSGLLRTTQFFPYPVTDTLGGRVMPENAGYVQNNNQLTDILETARLNRVLQCPYVGLFVHPFIFNTQDPTLENLRIFIQEIRKLGYTFFIPTQANQDLLFP